MKRILLLSTSLLALCLIGCDDSSTNPEGDVLWPMEVGNRWIGIKEYFDYRWRPLRTEYDTISIVGTVDIDGETWYEFDDGKQYTNRDDGVWTRVIDWMDRMYPIMIAKYPTTPGDTFQTVRFTTIRTGGQQGTGVQWIETLSTDSVCAVPMGRFRCHVYTTFLTTTPPSNNNRLDGSRALVPGVGPVMMIEDAPSDTAYSIWRLKETRIR